LAVEPTQEDNDEEITDAVHLVLEKECFVPAGPIRVHTTARVVTLEGVVPSDSLGKMAEFDAWYVKSVTSRQSRVHPRVHGPGGAGRADTTPHGRASDIVVCE
jgi:osmotically-inducible protein OsmY